MSDNDRTSTAHDEAAVPPAGGGPVRDLRITDSTLRDGSHAMQHQFTEAQVRGVVSALDAAGVEVIEVSHGDGLGGSSFNYGFSRVDEFDLIRAAVQEAKQAKIAVLMLPGRGTVAHPRPPHEAGNAAAGSATRCTRADVSSQRYGAGRDRGLGAGVRRRGGAAKGFDGVRERNNEAIGQAHLHFCLVVMVRPVELQRVAFVDGRSINRKGRQHVGVDEIRETAARLRGRRTVRGGHFFASDDDARSGSGGIGNRLLREKRMREKTGDSEKREGAPKGHPATRRNFLRRLHG